MPPYTRSSSALAASLTKVGARSNGGGEGGVVMGQVVVVVREENGCDAVLFRNFSSLRDGPVVEYIM